MLIKGKDLTPRQRQLVLAAFVHRHLSIGAGKYYDTEDGWIDSHAFHFVKDGTRLSVKHRYCEPEYFAD